MMDRCVELATVIGLWLMDSTQLLWFVIDMLASIALCTNSFLVAGIFNKNHSEKSFHYSRD